MTETTIKLDTDLTQLKAGDRIDVYPKPVKAIYDNGLVILLENPLSITDFEDMIPETANSYIAGYVKK